MLVKNKSFTPVIAFILIVLLEGMAFIHTYGPLTSPDFDLHVSSTYALATGQSFNRMAYADDPNFPGHRQVLTGDARILELRGGHNSTIEGINVTSLGEDLHHEEQYEWLNNGPYRSITVTARSNQYLFVLYIPQAIGMRLGISLGTKPSTALALSRISNFAVYMLLIVFAIILIPRGKGLMATIGLLPVSVFCASSLMCDSLIIAFTAFFTALSFKLYEQRKQISANGLVALTIAAVFLCLLKYAYAPFVLLPLLSRFALNRRQKIAYFTLTGIISGTITFLWQKFYAYVPRPDIYSQNKHLLISRPLQTIFRLLTNDIIVTFNKIKDTQLMMASLLLIIFVMAITLRSINPDENRQKSMVYLTCVFIALATLTLLSLSLFLTWNQIDDMKKSLALQGFQMRYYYPLLPLLLSLYIYPSSTVRKQSFGQLSKLPTNSRNVA
ncbi:DUF2142 domain-containing protein [Bifidobacterium mongoliense]|nr:DUF2142 domain-containing protein [Bifidobacterium mongoliense]